MTTIDERAHGPAQAPKDSLPPVPRTGWVLVAAKELGDHVRSVRFAVLLLLLAAAAAGTVYAAAGAIRDVAEEASGQAALFLRLFTVAPERLPAFFSLVGFLVPLLGIAFGFDAVNGERAQGTLPRLLAQPIHRDDVINGKFAAGLGVIALLLTSLTLLVAGVGLLRLGIVPTLPEAARISAWLVVVIVYVAFWLGLSTLASVLLRRAATSALASIAVWLLLTLFAGLLVGLAADALADPVVEPLRNAQLQQTLARLSPGTLYEEATLVLLNPQVRELGLLLPQQVDRALPTELALDQSLLVAWPQVVALVGVTVVCFALAYVTFLRQEVRA
jgi:ABC-2 type transport system permease protein